MSKSNSKNELSHKQLLTFSNLANLEWQFAQYKKELSDYKTAEDEAAYKTVSNLLTPESFVSGYRDPEQKQNPIYVYGDDGNGNCDTSQGLKEMRKHAGVAMEFKDISADFLRKWEVIYGADNYKIVDEFYENLYLTINGQEPAEEDKPYPTRDQIEDKKEAILNLRLTIKGLKYFVDIASFAIELGFMDDISSVTNEYTEDSIQKIAYKLTDKIADKLAVSIDDAAQVFTRGKIDAQYWSVKLLETIGSQLEDELTDQSQQLEKEGQVSATSDIWDLPLNKSLSMFDTGLRVVAFKKKDQIVIAFNKKDLHGINSHKDELLPQEKDLLRIVYSKIQAQNENSDIIMTGMNSGADLAGFNTFLYNDVSKLFYTRTPHLKNYLNYTPEDIDKAYHSTKEIVENTAQNTVSFGSIGGIITTALGSSSWFVTLAGILGFPVIKGIMSYIDSKNIRENYSDFLVDKWGIVKSEKTENIKSNSPSQENSSYNIAQQSSTSTKTNLESNKKIKGKIRKEKLDQETLPCKIADQEIEVAISDALYLMSDNLLEKEQGDIKSLLLGKDIKYKEEENPTQGWGLYRNLVVEEEIEEDPLGIRSTDNFEEIIEENFSDSEEGKSTKYKVFYHPHPNISNPKNILLMKQNSGKEGYHIHEMYKVTHVESRDPITPELEVNKVERITSVKKSQGAGIINSLRMVQMLQHSYLHNESDIEYIYPELSEGKEAGQEQIQITGELPAQIKYRPIIESLGQKEYAFVPYLKEDTLNTEGKLNQNYKRKAIEGMLARIPQILEQEVYDKLHQIRVNHINHIEVNEDKLKPEIIEETDSGECKIRCNFKNNPVEKVLQKFIKNDNIGPETFADFHYYRKVYNNLEKLIQDNYSINRQGPFNSEVTLESNSEEEGIQFTSSANIVDKLIIKATNLPEYALGYLLGSQVGEEKGQSGTIKLDLDKEKKLKAEDYNSESTIEIKGTQIGQGIKKIEDKNRLYQENQEYLEEYQETLKTDDKEQQDIKVRYIYKPQTQEIEFTNYSEDRFEKPYPVLMLRYGYGQSYDYVMTIAYFKDQDFGIDLPRKHKHKGSHNDKISEQFQINYACQPVSTHVNRKKSGSSQAEIFLDDLNREKSLGENIALIQEIKKKDTTIYRFAEPGKDTISAEEMDQEIKPGQDKVYYDYDIEANQVNIFYGKVDKYTTDIKEKEAISVFNYTDQGKQKQEEYTHILPKYGNKIEIEEFKNKDYNLKLDLDHPILQGKRRKQGDKEKREYNFLQGFPMMYDPRSNGKGKIVVDDQYSLQDQNIFNIPNENKYDFIIDKIEAEGKRLHQKIGKLANNLRYTVMRDNIKLMYIYDHLEKTLFVFYPDENNQAQTRFEVADEEIIIKDYHKIEIRDFDIKNKDYGIELPLEEINLTGLAQTKKVEVKEGDTLSKIAEQELGDEELWNQLEKPNGNKFTGREARRIKPGQEVYLPDREQKLEEKTLKEDIKIKKDSSNDIDPNYNGQGKIKVEGKYIGKDIHAENEDKWERKIFIDQSDNMYQKLNNVLIISIKNSKKKRKKILINGFTEGSFGLWLEELPPYHIDINDSLVKSKYENIEEKQGKIKGADQNKFLKDEKRIQHDILYIFPWEVLYKPGEKKAKKKQAQKEQEKAGNSPNKTRKKTKFDRDKARIKRIKNKEIQVKIGSTYYVVAGAKLQCSCGTAPCSLIVPPGKVMIENKPMANMMHFQPMTNITPFGMCTTTANPVVASATAAPPSGVLKPQPCIPQIVSPWVKSKPNVLVQGQPAITENSRLTCMWSGQISVQDPGQSTAVAH